MVDADPPEPEEERNGDDQAELREFLLREYWKRFSRLPPTEWDEQVRHRLLDRRRLFTSAMEVRHILAACHSDLTSWDPNESLSPVHQLLELGASRLVQRQAERLPIGPCLAFLCHSSDDKPRIREVREFLSRLGVDCWLDEVDILGGQDWEREICIAIERATVVLIFLSRNSVSKAGFIQRELKFALDRADERPEGAIYLIPVRLEECETPKRLQKFQRVDLFRPDGYNGLVRAIQTAAMPSAHGQSTEEQVDP